MRVMLPLISTVLVVILVLVEQILLYINKITVLSQSHYILTNIISLVVILGIALWYIYIR